MFKVRCYKKSGNLDHEDVCRTMDEAKEIRRAWAEKIGLLPEPSLDFARYPTIWRYDTTDGTPSWKRILGY